MFTLPEETPTGTIVIFNLKHWLVVKHVPFGDENGARVSFGFVPLLISITWVHTRYGFSFPAVGKVGKNSPRMAEIGGFYRL